jgi:hypothetical protein
MRTEKQEFANLQHRLRELRFVKGNTKQKVLQKMTKEDIDYLNHNCVGNEDDVDYDVKALHIFLTNKKVDEHNQKVIKIFENEGYKTVQVIARDNVITLNVDNATKINLLKGVIEKESGHTQGLEYSLLLVEGGRVAVTSNIDVANGISNGTMGVVKHFTRAENQQVKIIWIQLDNPYIGQDYRNKFKIFYQKHKLIDKSWTPIFAVARTFNTGGRGWKYFEVMRIQFPLTNAFARTLWKVQGATRFATTYIDFNHEGNRKGTSYSIRHANAHVVGISRVSDPKFLKIIGSFDDALVWKSEDADEEIDRLRRNANMPLLVTDLEKTSGYKIVFYNMQGLKSHYEDIKSDRNLMQADILMGAETNLNSTDPVSNYKIVMPEVTFNVKRFDDDSGKIGRGLIVYARQKITHLRKCRSNNGSATFEAMTFKVDIFGFNLWIVNIYCSPQLSINSIRKHVTELADSLHENVNVLIMGDFNTEKHLLDDPSYIQLIKGKY